jgi:hypothetical protein
MSSGRRSLRRTTQPNRLVNLLLCREVSCSSLVRYLRMQYRSSSQGHQRSGVQHGGDRLEVALRSQLPRGDHRAAVASLLRDPVGYIWLACLNVPKEEHCCCYRNDQQTPVEVFAWLDCKMGAVLSLEPLCFAPRLLI